MVFDGLRWSTTWAVSDCSHARWLHSREGYASTGRSSVYLLVPFLLNQQPDHAVLLVSNAGAASMTVLS